MVSMEVKQKMGPDVKVEVVDPGILLSRANLTFRRNGRLVRARNSMLPVLSSKACSASQDCLESLPDPVSSPVNQAASEAFSLPVSFL